MAVARNIRLGSHIRILTRSIPRSIGYRSKGGCVIQALGSHGVWLVCGWRGLHSTEGPKQEKGRRRRTVKITRRRRRLSH